MRYSQVFWRTLREAPREAETINHKLLVRAGYVRQVMAGVYTYLPLGLKVLNKISAIVRQEMNQIGAQEVLMPLLHPASIWKQTGGWDNVDVLFKLNSRTKKEYALAQSNEETVTPLVKEWVHNEKDLPLSVYHINWKFRDELRSKSGILRGREFLMKDMYSWHKDQTDFDRFYEMAKKAYLEIFTKLGLVAKVTEASGGAFSEKLSYEFEVLTEAGEANILYCANCDYCVNIDDITKYQENDLCPKCAKSNIQYSKAAEVGNVFDLGQKYCKAFDLTIPGADGEKVYPVMGCYGIGISRTMGVLVEKFNDQKGIAWPEAVAPFKAHLINIKAEAQGIYDELVKAGIEVIWDDTQRGAGEKFADADLMGMPVRLVVSEKTNGKIEWKARQSETTQLLSLGETIEKLSRSK